MKQKILELVEDIAVSVVDIANYPDNSEHLDYAQDQLIELRKLVKQLPN